VQHRVHERVHDLERGVPPQGGRVPVAAPVDVDQVHEAGVVGVGRAFGGVDVGAVGALERGNVARDDPRQRRDEAGRVVGAGLPRVEDRHQAAALGITVAVPPAVPGEDGRVGLG